METIDLREKPRGCREHPLIKLKRITSSMNKGSTIKVIGDNNIIPLKTIEIIAQKNNLKLNIIKRINEVYEVILEKN